MDNQEFLELTVYFTFIIFPLLLAFIASIPLVLLVYSNIIKRRLKETKKENDMLCNKFKDVLKDTGACDISNIKKE